MKGVLVQLTSFMSSVYITEDRIIEKGIVQVWSLVCWDQKNFSFVTGVCIMEVPVWRIYIWLYSKTFIFSNLL